MTDEPETTDDEQLADVDDALESAGFVDDGENDGESDAEQESQGLFAKVESLSGTGKSLDSYENDPIASVFARDDGSIPRGAKHIARGVDGLSPFAAAHPLIDIGVGFVLLAADDETDGSLFGGDDDKLEKGDDGDDSHYRGDMT